MKLTKILFTSIIVFLITLSYFLIIPPQIARAQSCVNEDGSNKPNGTRCSGCGPVDCAATGCGGCRTTYNNGCGCEDGECLSDYGCEAICPSNNTEACTASCSGCSNDKECPPIAPPETHKICPECNRCVTVDGPGPSDCETGADCPCDTPTQAPPTPTPTQSLNCADLTTNTTNPTLGSTISLTCQKNASYTGATTFDYMSIRKDSASSPNPNPLPTPFAVSQSGSTSFTFPADGYGHYLFMCRVCAGAFCTSWQDPNQPCNNPLTITNANFEAGNTNGWFAGPNLSTPDFFAVNDPPNSPEGNYFLKVKRAADTGNCCDAFAYSAPIETGGPVAGKTFSVSFKAKIHSGTATLGGVHLEANINNARWGSFGPVNLTTSWQTFTKNITISTTDNSNVALPSNLTSLVLYLYTPDPRTNLMPVYYDDIKISGCPAL